MKLFIYLFLLRGKSKSSVLKVIEAIFYSYKNVHISATQSVHAEQHR